MTNSLKKELFDKLAQDSTLFDLVREQALDGIWYRDLNNPEKEWIDNRFWETLGYDPGRADFSAPAWQDIIHPEDNERLQESISSYLKAPTVPIDLIGRYNHKEGYWLWLRSRLISITDKGGKPQRILAIHTEITALKRSEQLLEKASQAARIGFWEVDLDNQKTFWSKVTREIHEVSDGFDSNVESGINFYEEGFSRDRISELVDKAINKGEQFDEELRIITATNSKKWVRAIGIPELDRQGKCRRLYGLFQDIDFQVNSRQAIRSERELYRQVIEGANLGAWEMNFESEEIIVNRRLTEIIGHDFEQLRRIGFDQWFDLIHKEDRPLFDQKLAACVSGADKELSAELRLERKNGRYIWVSVNAKVFSPADIFKVERLVGTVQDISPFKEKGEILRTFISDNPLAMAMLDTKMRYIACSDKWYSDYDIQDKNIIGKSHYQVFPNISDEWKAFHRRCLQGEVLKTNEDSFEVSPGKRIWLRWEIRPWYQEDNKVGGMIMFTENITERKLIEQNLQISEEAFRGNFENAAIGMAIIDKKGYWLKVNDKVCEITGYPADELMKLSYKDITHPEDLNIDLNLVQELIEGKRDNYQLEKRYIKKDGSIAYVLLGAAVVRNEQNEVLHFISQVIDISKRKKAEMRAQELLDATMDHNQRLNSFAHIVSHNLRTHSAGISKLLDYLKEDSSAQEVLDLAIEASRKLNNTIDDLNKVVEIQGQTQGSFYEISVMKAIEEAQSVLRIGLQNAILEINTIEQPTIKGLQVYLNSIVFNLMSNALKYRDPSRRPHIKIKDRLEKDWYALSITDNGLGIDLKRHKDRLFGMYNTFHENPEARGLGLYLLKNQVESMGGKVEVKSELSVGSTFTIYLPYEEN